MESAQPNFPLSKWCKIFEKCDITLNPIHPSGINSKLSTYAQLFVTFGHQIIQLTPNGMKVMARVIPIYHCSFNPRVIQEFSVGVATEHYRLFKIFIPSTGRVRIAETIIWLPMVTSRYPPPPRMKFLAAPLMTCVLHFNRV